MADNNQPLVPTGECTHVGVVVKDIEEVKQFFSKVFGWGPWGPRVMADWNPDTGIRRGKPITFKGPREWLKLGPVSFEVGETHGESIHTEFMKSNGGGLHHLAFEVDDVEDAVDKLEKVGVPLLQAGMDKNGKFIYVYMSTREATGSNIIIELNPRQR